MNEATIKLAAQVQGLELVLKLLITVQLTSQIKSEEGFAKAATLADALKKQLLSTIDAMEQAAPLETRETDTAAIMLATMRETVSRCFEKPGSDLDQLASLLLAASEPPTPARN